MPQKIEAFATSCAARVSRVDLPMPSSILVFWGMLDAAFVFTVMALIYQVRAVPQAGSGVALDGL